MKQKEGPCMSSSTVTGAAQEKNVDDLFFSSSRRPLLIFKHNPKVGGSFTKKLVAEFKPMVMQDYDAFPLCYYDNDVDVDPPIEINFNNTLIIVQELLRVRKWHRQKGFVISTMREPCDQYLSLWSFGSTRRGYLHEKMEEMDYNWTVEAYGHDSPTFNSTEDIHRFQKLWLPDPKISGMIDKRYRQSYGDPDIIERGANGTSTRYGMPEAVDCWIFLDDYDATLYTCLQEYEIQGGMVDWDAPLLSKRVKSLQELNETIELETYTNDSTNNKQLSHHSKCPTYFDTAAADIVQLGRESYIYDLFGYQGCCKGRISKNALIHSPVLVPKRHQESFDLEYSSRQFLIFILVAPVVVMVLVFVRFLKKKKSTTIPRYESVSTR